MILNIYLLDNVSFLAVVRVMKVMAILNLGNES